MYNFLLNSVPYSNVLDIGAGSGNDLALSSQVAPRAARIAIEAHAPYVEKLSQQGIQVHSLNIEKDRFPFADESIDVVIANQVLEHTKELFWIFHEITRVLPLRGKFIIGVPNLASLHNRLLLLIGRQPTPIQNASAHVRGYTRHDLIRFLSLCFPGGYELKHFGGSNFYPFPPILARPMAHILPNMAWGIFLMFEKKKTYSHQFLEFPVEQKLETNYFLGPP
jgi:SAM-dependent methyltransferase